MEKSIIGASYMHDFERRELKRKLLEIVKQKFEAMRDLGYSYSDICGILNVPNSRVSEIVRGKTKTIQDQIILGLINGGYLTVEEIQEQLGPDITDKEKRWIADLAIHQEPITLEVARELSTLPIEDVKMLLTKIRTHGGLSFLKKK